MNESSDDRRTFDQPSQAPVAAPPARTPRWKRAVRAAAIAVCFLLIVVAYLLKDHVSTLQSLRRVPGTNAYVMDYYVDYNIDEIRAHGMDVDNIEDGLIDVFFPDFVASMARGFKGRYLDEKIETTRVQAERCSTVALRTPQGRVFFGRNLDWLHDACLILRVHKRGVPASVSVIDLHYLNLDRNDLESLSLLQRIPLLFAPYYVQDGMNRHGVAVSDMSVDGVATPFDGARPNLLHSTAMRLILDDARTTDEAVEILERYNIFFVATTCHLMIADARGKSAVVEFVDGAMEVTPARENWQVCTNHQLCGSSEADSDAICDRYRTASEQLAGANSTAGAEDVMRIMESVSKENWTMWSSVYDLTARSFRIAYRRHFDKPYAGSLAVEEGARP